MHFIKMQMFKCIVEHFDMREIHTLIVCSLIDIGNCFFRSSSLRRSAFVLPPALNAIFFCQSDGKALALTRMKCNRS